MLTLLCAILLSLIEPRSVSKSSHDKPVPVVTRLLPAHTSTEWFHDYALPFAELYWVRGKRKFGASKDRALMPSVAVVFRRPA